jgi:hypothetical protein
LGFANPGKTNVITEDATLKELRRCSPLTKRRNSFRVATNAKAPFIPRFQSKPWLELVKLSALGELFRLQGLNNLYQRIIAHLFPPR